MGRISVSVNKIMVGENWRRKAISRGELYYRGDRFQLLGVCLGQTYSMCAPVQTIS
jgi:hypothetical protein